MSERICRECGADTWKASNYDELVAARDRHWKTNREQAIEILTLKLRVAELEEHERTRQRKTVRQARVIRRLEDRLRELNQFPYEGFGLGETAPVAQNVSPVEDDGIGPHPRGMRKMRRRRETTT